MNHRIRPHKVKKVTEVLFHTTEGYNRAIAILKEKYGKESEIVKAYIKGILDLPHIAYPEKIAEFYEKLLKNLQSLETMNKLGQVDGAVAMTIDKLPAI